MGYKAATLERLPFDGVESRLLFSFSSRRRHTRLQGDWSSDVCSSDLNLRRLIPAIERELRDADVRRERRRAQTALLERARLAELTSDVGIALTQGTDLRAMLQLCAEALVRHLDVAFARIWTLDDASGILELQASAGMYTHINGAHSRVRLGQYEIGAIARERRP